MSYILDALRKSDQQRRHGAPPTLLATYTPGDGAKRRLSMTHIVVATVLVVAGVAIGSLRPWLGEQPAAPTEPVAGPTLEAIPPPPPAPAVERPQVLQESARDVPARKTARSAQLTPAPVGDANGRQVSAVTKGATPRRTRVAQGETNEAPPPEIVQPGPGKPAAGKAHEPEQRVIAMSELPLALQQEMPSISFSVHAYSRVPADRLIGIKDRVFREGEYVAPGLLLEQITPDGVIMTYRGYRFQRSAR